MLFKDINRILGINDIKRDLNSGNGFIEILAFFVINFGSVITWIYGFFWIRPILYGESSILVQLTVSVIGCWCFIAVISNLALIRLRKSSIQGNSFYLSRTEPEQTRSEKNENSDDGTYLRHSSLGETLINGKACGDTSILSYEADSGEIWHSCPACETFVPPRAWHCATCRTCIIRRCHHCLFTMSCIGQENLGNFLSFTFYLSMGSSFAVLHHIYYSIFLNNMNVFYYFIRTLFTIYFIIDLNMDAVLSTLNIVCCLGAWSMFLGYTFITMMGQTSADVTKKIKREKLSYAALEKFLGPNPIFRILWPFHPINAFKMEAVDASEKGPEDKPSFNI